MIRNGRKMVIFEVTIRLGESDFFQKYQSYLFSKCVYMSIIVNRVLITLFLLTKQNSCIG